MMNGRNEKNIDKKSQRILDVMIDARYYKGLRTINRLSRQMNAKMNNCDQYDCDLLPATFYYVANLPVATFYFL